MKTLNRSIYSVIVLAGTTFCLTALGQNPHADRLDPASLNQQGQMINLKVVPANKNLQVFLMGKKGADIQFNNTKLTAKLRLSNRSIQNLKVNRESSHYVIPADQLQSHDATQIELTTDMGQDSETFTIDLK